MFIVYEEQSVSKAAMDSPAEEPVLEDMNPETLSTSPSAPDELSDAQQALQRRLQAWRKQQAQQQGLAPYHVLTNRELDAIIRVHPRDKSTLASIDGIGPAKMKNYAEQILRMLAATPQSATTQSPGVNPSAAHTSSS